MNEQELYDKINQLPSILGWQGHGAKIMIAKDSVLELVRQLDEPKKVIIPQFVAEWIILAREKCLTLRQALDHYSVAGEIEKWLQYASNQELFARAWLDGYTVELEKLYTVEIPDKANHPFIQTHLAKNNQGNVVIFQAKRAGGWAQEETAQLTEAEIRKDFEWAWPFAREVE